VGFEGESSVLERGNEQARRERERERERGGGEMALAAVETMAFGLPTKELVYGGSCKAAAGSSTSLGASSSLFGTRKIGNGSCGHEINVKRRRSAVARAELMQASRPISSFEYRTRFSLSLFVSLAIRA
jgi:hypothetical protein